MRKTLLAIAALWATGCSHTQLTTTNPEPQASITNPKPRASIRVIDIEGTFRYIIDPHTESCLLREYLSNGLAMVHVSCAKLKKNVPEAAAFITWEPSDAAPTAPGTGTSSAK